MCYRDYIVCVGTWLAVDTMGYEDVYTPKSGKRPKGHASCNRLPSALFAQIKKRP